MDAGYLVDTNVVSEVCKKSPDANVIKWLDSHENLSISVITIEEMRFGEFMMPKGKKRNKLHELIDSLAEHYSDSTLVFDTRATEQCAVFHENAIASGRTPTIEDMMIAAIAKVNGLVLVTRNVRDFEYLDIEVVDPFEGQSISRLNSTNS